jgi:hypothetical protein
VDPPQKRVTAGLVLALVHKRASSVPPFGIDAPRIKRRVHGLQVAHTRRCELTPAPREPLVPPALQRPSFPHRPLGLPLQPDPPFTRYAAVDRENLPITLA